MKMPSSHLKAATFVPLLLCASLVVWFLCPIDPPVWRLRTIFHIGTVADPALVLEGSRHPQVTVERHTDVVALISSPGFRQIITNTTEFESHSAALSRRLVFETLRPHALNDNSIDIELDVTAASAADCRAIYQNIAGRILQRHARLFDQKVALLQTAIDEFRERSAQLRKWKDAEFVPGSQAYGDTDSPKSGIVVSWNETEERLRRLEAVKTQMSPTTFPPESEVYIDGPLTNETVRFSALAGLVIILCTLLLGLELETHPSNRRDT